MLSWYHRQFREAAEEVIRVTIVTYTQGFLVPGWGNDEELFS